MNPPIIYDKITEIYFVYIYNKDNVSDNLTSAKMDLKCRICNKECKSAEGLSNHISYFHIKKGEIYSLEEYYKKYESSDTLNICENPSCTNPTKFISVVRGYERHCSFKCSCENPMVRKRKSENTKKAVLAKYGVDNISKVAGIAEKVKVTKFERYGDRNYNNVEQMIATNIKNHNGVFSTATDEYKTKYIKTVLAKYGVDHHTKSKQVKETTISTNMDRYGVEWGQQLPEIKQKSLDTSVARYGGTLHGSPILSSRIKATNLEKYGVEYPLQNTDILEKVQKTNLDRYGGITALQNKRVLQRIYGVDDINQIEWVVEKQKVNRKSALLDKYQVENVSQLAWVQDLIKKSNQKKYGVGAYFQTDEFRQKYKESSILKYGVENPMQNVDVYNKCMTAQSHSYRLHEYTLKNGNVIHYQSKPELRFIQYCEENNIEIFDGDAVEYTLGGVARIYRVDFKIKQNDRFRLIEIKGKHKWYWESLESGEFLTKVIAAQMYSTTNGYLPYKILFNNKYTFKNDI
jgi:hypothetical protein